ncbi:bifunctional adenosylcobinamide kinase/adenosylcobinamide-phosphate guanylyltransferase [soil metagenome]
MAAPFTFVLGGARSGKSAVGERLAAALGPVVTYVATAQPPRDGVDPGFAARIAAHRDRRSTGWRTVESGPDLASVLAGLNGPVLVDSLGTWVAGLSDFRADPGALCRALIQRDGPTVVVSDEVGLGVVPSTDAGGRFRDALGEVNTAVAAVADEVLLVVAGRVLRLGAP